MVRGEYGAIFTMPTMNISFSHQGSFNVNQVVDITFELFVFSP